MMDHLEKELNLNAKQKKDLTKIHISHFKKVRKELEFHREVMEKNEKQMEVFKMEIEKEVADLLDKEQNKKYMEIIEKRRPHKREHKGPPGKRK